MSQTTRFRAMVDALFSARRLGVILDVSRVERALAALGHPERRPRVRVHIGGTNGKGSVAAFVDAAARQCGVRTGLFTSPHLSHFAERFRIQGEPAAARDVLDAYQRMRTAPGQGDEELTFFEQITVMGLCLFESADVELAILEVGIGGRLDATNAVAAEIACVTGVALDHQDYLGTTVPDIAAEKAGIFKPGQRAVIGRSGEPEAVPLLLAHARRVGVAHATVVAEPVPADMRLGLRGTHQRDNAACALAVLGQLAEIGAVPAAAEAWARGFAQTTHPGRMEIVAHAPTVLLDGAHNPHGAAMLGQAMLEWSRPRVLVLGVCRDKDIDGVARALLAAADAVICTQADDPRAAPCAELGARVEHMIEHMNGHAMEHMNGHTIGHMATTPGGPTRLHSSRVTCTAIPVVADALASARALAGSSGTVVVAGSLFLVGAARRVMLDQPATLDTGLSDPVSVVPPGLDPIRLDPTRLV